MPNISDAFYATCFFGFLANSCALFLLEWSSDEEVDDLDKHVHMDLDIQSPFPEDSAAGPSSAEPAATESSAEAPEHAEEPSEEPAGFPRDPRRQARRPRIQSAVQYQHPRMLKNGPNFEGGWGRGRPHPMRPMNVSVRQRFNARQQQKNTRRTLRGGRTAALAALEKMGIPGSMLRRPGDFSSFDEKMSCEPSLKIVSANSFALRSYAERFSDPFVQKMVERGLTNADVQTKVVSMVKLASKLSELRTFTDRSVNKGIWAAERTYTVTNGGLTSCLWFLEELLAYAQACVESGLVISELLNDVILSTANVLAKNLLLRLRFLIDCYVTPFYLKSLFKQLGYQVYSSDRLESAARILKELQVTNPLLTLYTLALTVPVLMMSDDENYHLTEYYTTILTRSRPGTVISLFNSIITEHRITCTRNRCVGTTVAMLGPQDRTKGLLFLPTT